MHGYQELDRLLYGAFLEAAKKLGPDLKKLSWFGRNKKVWRDSADDEAAKAA